MVYECAEDGAQSLRIGLLAKGDDGIGKKAQVEGGDSSGFEFGTALKEGVFLDFQIGETGEEGGGMTTLGNGGGDILNLAAVFG